MAIKEIRWNSHEEWLSIRQWYIGGSDAGAVIGLNPYKSAYTLWAEKCGAIQPFDGNLTTEVGSYLEEFVAELFTRETGKKVRRKNATLVNDRYPFACANLDRVIVGEKAFLEIKTTNSIPIMKRLRDETDFPDLYYAQCVHYLAVTGLERAHLAVLVNCRELLTFTLERDEDEIAALMEAEREFWQEHVLTCRPPEIDGSASTAETIETLAGVSTDDEVDLTPMADELRHYQTLKELSDDTDKAMEQIKNKLRAYMGDAGRGDCAGFKVRYQSQERRTLDKKALAAAHPEIDVARYEKVSSSRPMVIKATA